MNKFTFCLPVFVLALAAQVANGQRAGQGTYQPKILPPPAVPGAPVDNQPFTGHYLRLEASTWFMNDQGNVLRDKTVSGTIDIRLGDETYQVVLGTYELSRSNQTAPVFNKAILDYRAYRGGDLRLIVFVKGIKKDRLLGSLLKNVATSAIGIAGEKIASVTTLGFSSVLTGAGQELFTGVQDALRSGESPYSIFEEAGGLDFTIPRSELTGREKFFLAYRGNDINNRRVQVVNSGQGVYDITVDGTPLRQGAWLLFRIAREDAYGNQRPWRPKAEKALADIDDLMQNWRLGAKTQQEVATALTPTLRSETLADTVLAVRSEIRADEALTVTEKSLEAGRLVALLEIARNAAGVADGYTQYFASRDEYLNSIRTGTPLAPSSARDAFMREISSVSEEARAVSLTIMRNEFSELRTVIRPEAQPLAPTSEVELWRRFAEIERARPTRRVP